MMNPSLLKQPFFLTPEVLLDKQTGWSILGKGVHFRLLFHEPDTGYRAGLIRYEPGASVPFHRHDGDEHIYILSGSQQDERGLYRAGSYIYNPEGSEHSVSSHDGCLVLAHWLKPVQFLAE
ncbi:MAG: cupin domain-containing protein [Methylococcales bacterium]|nr:cupin domain-containing protein [Methylococcales bacterium]